MPQFKAFRAQVDAGVLTVTLDDPPLNRIGPTFAEDLIALIQEAEASPAYRVVVFESAVANYFSAHVDLTRVPQLLGVIQQFLPGEFLGMVAMSEFHPDAIRMPSDGGVRFRKH